MNGWRELLDSLDTPGGHIFVLVMLMVLGIAMVHFGESKGEEVLIGTFGALLAMLRGSVTNHNRQNGKEPQA